jgi:hypothetical protein
MVCLILMTIISSLLTTYAPLNFKIISLAGVQVEFHTSTLVSAFILTLSSQFRTTKFNSAKHTHSLSLVYGSIAATVTFDKSPQKWIKKENVVKCFFCTNDRLRKWTVPGWEISFTARKQFNNPSSPHLEGRCIDNVSHAHRQRTQFESLLDCGLGWLHWSPPCPNPNANWQGSWRLVFILPLH